MSIKATKNLEENLEEYHFNSKQFQLSKIQFLQMKPQAQYIKEKLLNLRSFVFKRFTFLYEHFQINDKKKKQLKNNTSANVASL